MNLWLKAAVQGAACGVMFGLVVVVRGRLWWPQVAGAQGKEAAVADVVKARRFEVVDMAGSDRVVFGLLPLEGVALVLFDRARKIRAVLYVERDGTPSLELVDGGGKTRARLGVRRDDLLGELVIVLWDRAGNQRVTVGVGGMAPA